MTQILQDTVPAKGDLLEACGKLRAEGLEFWRRIEAVPFWSRQNVVWSPADNVRHLILSTVPVARALRVPRLILRALFGVAQTPSRNWNFLCSTYLEGLARGGTAGSYTPKQAAAPTSPQEGQKQLVGQFAFTLLRLEEGIKPWNEKDLERYRLPHPLLGRLTVREMLMFTLFHVEHHRQNVARRVTAPYDP